MVTYVDLLVNYCITYFVWDGRLSEQHSGRFRSGREIHYVNWSSVTGVLNVLRSVETVVMLYQFAWHSILQYLYLHIFFIHSFGCAIGSGYLQSLFGAEIFIDFVSFPLQLQEELLLMSCVKHISLWIFLYVQLFSMSFDHMYASLCCSGFFLQRDSHLHWSC
jgi:hypothetical protein